MVATTEKKPVKGKEDSKKLPAVPESVLKHRKRRDALRTRRIQVTDIHKPCINTSISLTYHKIIHSRTRNVV